MATSSSKIRVAILGGGLAGATLVRGLAKHSHLQVDIFESAPVFREQGQAIGTNQNGIWALELLGLKQCIVDAGAIHLDGIRARVGYGTDMGTIIEDLNLGQKGTWITPRATFLEQVLKGVDPAALHTGKKLSKIEQDKDITLHFEDGSTHTCDVAIGADGINSNTRRYVVGNDHDASFAFAGWQGTWTLVPIDKAIEKLGPELVDTASPYQYAWVGPNAFVMHDITGNGTLVQCVITKRVPEDIGKDPSSNAFGTVSAAELGDTLKDWDPRLAKGMVELSLSPDGGPTPLMSLRHHKPIPSFVRGRVAIAGDAAGATTPWQGSGGGMAMEDAYLLSELFANVKTVQDAGPALLAYDSVNRDRRHRLMASSYETGLIMTGCHPEAGMDLAGLRKQLAGKFDWILNVDLLANRDAALRKMRDLTA